MRTLRFLPLRACAWAFASMLGTAAAGEVAPTSASVSPSAAPLYELVDPLPFALGALRWTPVPVSRLELATGLLPRHELRLTGTGTREAAAAWAGDALRGTYRYTFFEQRDWTWKLGLSARLADSQDAGRARLGSRPLLHVAGQARLASNWRLDFDADGNWAPRARALDLGIRVSYLLSRSFAIYGGYRYAEPAAEPDDSAVASGHGANIGLRYRF
ncbi:MAG: hypothetical protein NZL99_09525 [Burkholderiaceae bacterium]|nr:hypothetical protein [Burkholderiaceae bacterium]